MLRTHAACLHLLSARPDCCSLPPLPPRTTRIPTLYVLGRTPVQAEEAAEKLLALLPEEAAAAGEGCVLVADTDCAHALPAVAEALRHKLPKLQTADIDPVFSTRRPLDPVPSTLAAPTVQAAPGAPDEAACSAHEDGATATCGACACSGAAPREPQVEAASR